MKLNQNTHRFSNLTPKYMSRNLYSPRLSDDVVRALYREGQRRRMPMTRIADRLLRQALRSLHPLSVALHVRPRPEELPADEAAVA